MMDPKSMIKQMLDFDKATFYSTFKGFIRMQEQAEQMAITLCDKVPCSTEAGKKAMTYYVAAHKNLHDYLIAMMDDNFRKVEEYLAK